MKNSNADNSKKNYGWLIEPSDNEEDFVEELLELRPPCARSSLLTHKRGLADKMKPKTDNQQ